MNLSSLMSPKKAQHVILITILLSSSKYFMFWMHKKSGYRQKIL